MKTCVRCQRFLSESEFSPDRIKADGLGSWCHKCNMWRNTQFSQTPAGKETYARYGRTDKGKARHLRHDQTPKGKMMDARHHHKRRSLVGDQLLLTVEQWEELKAEYDYKCAYCRRDDRPLAIDHIIPISHGGTNDRSNLAPACKSCNSKKQDRLGWIPEKRMAI